MKNLLLFSCLLLVGVLFSACVKPYPHLKDMSFADLEYPYDVKKTKIQNTINLAYVDEGSGSETIIFIHGLGSYLPAWKHNIESLKDNYRCIAIDLPGYGKSSKGVHPFSMEFYADVLVEFMDNLNITSATLTGHSMGGQISMVTALKYPDRVKNLVLIAPAGFEKFNAGEKKWFRDVMTVTLVKKTPVQNIRANLAANFYNMPEDAQFMVTDRIALRKAKDFEAYCYAVTRNVSGMIDQPVYHLLNKIEQKTLIIFGENDNLIPNPYLHPGRTARIAEYGHSQIPNSTLVLIPQCGHFAQFEKAAVVNEAMTDFLR